jgi:hypothetical protein
MIVSSERPKSEVFGGCPNWDEKFKDEAKMA